MTFSILRIPSALKLVACVVALAGAVTFSPAAQACALPTASPAEAIAPVVAAPADAQAELNRAFGLKTLANGKFVWKEGTTRVDRLIVTLSLQIIYAYEDGELVGASTVSTGRPGYETQTGNFRILAKHRYYRSRKYQNAPMPYMQQITSYGVALHAGQLPGYPASHGCIRLPTKFAANLFATTQIGIPVQITP